MKKQEKIKTRATGVIDKVIYDAGSVMYYVFVEVEGKRCRVQSINYSDSKNNLKEGMQVTVDYYKTRGGKIMVEIVNEDIISCNEAAKQQIPYFILGFVIFIILVIIMIIRDYFL